MKLSRLRVQHVRNHTEFMAEFGEHATLIYGKNGTGKTSLLEAIYIAFRGTSFRGSDSDVLNHAKQWFRVDAVDETGVTRTAILDNRGERSQREYIVDDKKSAKLPLRYKRPIILFTPNDLRLVDGSPARRREYLDSVLSQLDPQYGSILRRYERTLQQRNKLLKTARVTSEQFFSWNVILSEAGAYIINARHTYIERLNQRINHHYHSIADSKDMITVHYTHPAVTAATLLARLEQNFDRDMMMGNTSIGPHRHDVDIRLRGIEAADSASRGETRTIVVAMKYFEAEIVYEQFGEYPLVLLDDVYGELDMERRRNLSHTLKDYQIIITSTDKITGLPRGARRIEL